MRQASRIVEVEPTTEAARMFWLNFQAWRQDPYVEECVDPAAFGELEADLRRLVDAEDRDRIHWQLRQLVFAREDA